MMPWRRTPATSSDLPSRKRAPGPGLADLRGQLCGWLWLSVLSPSSSHLLVLPILPAASVALLALLGGLAAQFGRAPVLAPSMRVAVLGALAMAVTAGVGRLFGAVI